MENQINQLQLQINELQHQIDMMRSSASFPYDVEQAIIERLDLTVFDASAKTAASATQAVNEAGTNTYDVAKPMDGFEQRVVDGSIRHYPYYL